MRKRKAGVGAVSSSSTEDSETGWVGIGSGGNLDSTAIRTFAGAGEAQSRAQVKKETAAVHKNASFEKYRQERLAHTEKLVQAVQTLSDFRCREAASGRRGCS